MILSESFNVWDIVTIATAVSLGSAVLAGSITLAVAIASCRHRQPPDRDVYHLDEGCRDIACSRRNQPQPLGSKASPASFNNETNCPRGSPGDSDRMQCGTPTCASELLKATEEDEVPHNEENPTREGLQLSGHFIDPTKNLESSFEAVSPEMVASEATPPKVEVWEYLESPEAKAGKPEPTNPTKRSDYLSWDDYFMSVAFLSAQRSKDPNRQVGACIVGQDMVILGIGYNGFPRGIHDDHLPWAKVSEDGDPLKTKYPYVCHAEVNAILNRNHASAPGQRIYVTMFPCNECAKMIIQSGINEVIYFTDKGNPDGKVRENPTAFSYMASRRLLGLASIKVRQHKPARKRVILEFV